MGFRKHRRRGGGGFGGGQHHHGWGTGEPNGLQPGDDVGNRRSFKAVQIPPDDLGNRKDPDEAEWIPEDNVGNRIDAAPTHELSGVLLDLDGKRRRRRPKGVAAPERVGRYFIGGVNPLIATTTPRPFPGKTLEESMNGTSVEPAHGHEAEAPPLDGEEAEGGFEDGERRGRRRRRGRGRDQVDGMAAQEVSERRAQRFFDFEEDDRFDYTLKTPAEQKRKDAEDAVRSIVTEAGRDAVVLARLIEDGTRPKVLVTIDEKGPAPSLPPERRSDNAQEPLFVMGNAALMSLNYLVNKIVNRYPDDRIRLAILPAADERLYLDALAEHQKLRTASSAPAARPAPAPAPAPAAVAVPAPVDPVEAALAEAAPAEAPSVDEAPAPAAVEAEPAAKPARRGRRAAAVEEPAEEPAAAASAEEGEEVEEVEVDEKPKARPKKAAAKKADKDDDEKPKRAPRRGTKKAPAVEVVRASAPRKA